jgi:hypothetical protein
VEKRNISYACLESNLRSPEHRPSVYRPSYRSTSDSAPRSELFHWMGDVAGSCYMHRAIIWRHCWTGAFNSAP